jgi:sugar diacid utilization regulator/GAF domain-containing protein
VNGTTVRRGERIEADLLAVLELLSTSAPIDQYEALVADARDRGVGGVALQELETAKRLGLTLYSQILQRQRRESNLFALIDLTHELATPHDLDTLLMIIVRRARLLLGMDLGSAGLLDPRDPGWLTIRTGDGQVTPHSVGKRVPVDAGLTRLALGHHAPVWTADYLADEQLTHEPTMDGVARAERLRAMLVVPLASGPRQFGALYVADRTVRHFTPDECALMSSLGAVAGAAVERTLAAERQSARIDELERRAARAEAELAGLRTLQHGHDRFSDLVLAGATLDTLTAEASLMLGGTVSIHSASGAVLASAAEDGTRESTHLVAATAAADGRPVPVDGGWAVPVTAQASYLGFVLARPERPGDRPDEAQLLLVARTAAVLQLQNDRPAGGWTRDELLDDLLSPNLAPHAADRVARLGVGLDRPHVVIVARLGDAVPGRAAIWASSYASRHNGLRGVRDGAIVLLLPGSDGGAAARTVSRQLSALLDRPVTGGAGGPVTDPRGVYQAYLEAVRCVEAVTALGGAGHAASPHELGFLGVLLSGDQDVDRFIRAVIGPVVDYDRRRPATALARTLEAYFEASGSPTNAAEKLHIHPNTVGRRLDRIRDLLGPDWQSPERALDIQLALRLCRIRESLRADVPGWAAQQA